MDSYSARPRCALTLAILGVLLLPQAWAQTALNYRKPPAAEWPLLGGDWGNTRYSTLAKISTSNVKTVLLARGDVHHTVFDHRRALLREPGAEPRIQAGHPSTLEPAGFGSGLLATAGGLVFHGGTDGFFRAFASKTGEELWRFQTGFGADAPAATYEIDGEQYVAIAAGGSRDGYKEARGDLVWSFKLGGRLNPLNGPPAPRTIIVTESVPNRPAE